MSVQPSMGLDAGLAGLVAAAAAGASAQVEQGATLPPAAYMSQGFFDLETAGIFRQEWHCLGHVSQIPRVGDYVTRTLLGEPLIVVRGPDRIRVLSGVCLHRWAPVATGSGNVKLFSCPFHKWGYALDGRLLGAPFMEQAVGFEPCAHRLPEIRSEVVEEMGLIFATFSEAVPPIGERLGELRERALGWGMRDQVVVKALEFDNRFNWKIQIETYMECYHHIGAHRESIEPTSPGGLSWCEPDKGGWTVCHSGVKPGLEAEPEPFQLILVYPLTMIGANSTRIDVQTLMPVGPNRTRSTWYFLMRAEDAASPALEATLAARLARHRHINSEDLAVNDMQQYGAASALARPGRFSHLEACSWHLAEYVRARVAPR